MCYRWELYFLILVVFTNWFEKLTELAYSEFIAKLHFWVFFVRVNLGVAGIPRRIPDYPDTFYTFNKIASWDLMFQLFL